MNTVNIDGRYRYNECGLTLIEVMVAAVVGLLVVGGAIDLFISNQRIYREQEMMSRLQESARLTMETVLNDIQSAGYIGCLGQNTQAAQTGLTNNIASPVASAGGLLDFDNPIEGLEEGAIAWSPSNNQKDVVKDRLRGDAITVRYFLEVGRNLAVSQMGSSASPVRVNTKDTGLSAGDALAVADCLDADIFSASAIQTTSNHTNILHVKNNSNGLNNKSNKLERAYTQNTRLYQAIARRYFIGDDNGQPALQVQQYTQDANGVYQVRTETLVRGVENMQILYGERGTRQFNNATAVTDWNDVFAVRIALLFRTMGEDTTFPQDTGVYTLLGTNYNPVDDFRRRRIFLSTALMRNM